MTGACGPYNQGGSATFKGCTKEFMMLQSMLKLLVLKARDGLSDVGFDAFLSIVADMLPKENKVHANTYYGKKLISPLTMGVEKIHACINHCILQSGDDYKNLESCPKCGANRYKMNKYYREEQCAASGKKQKKTQKNNQKSSKPSSKEKEVDYYVQKKIPPLVMWYFPIVGQLRCLFTNPKDIKHMSWHASHEHKNDGKLRHLADGKQWQDFNKNHRDFADEPRNVRFTLSTNSICREQHQAQHMVSDPHHVQPSSMVEAKAKVPFANHLYFLTYTTWS